MHGVDRRLVAGLVFTIAVALMPSHALGKKSYNYKTSLYGPGPKRSGVSAVAQVKYERPVRDSKLKALEEPETFPPRSVVPVSLSPTPPLSVCQTRTFPATKCAFYSFAPPPETDPAKEKNKKRPSAEELAAVAADRAIALAPEPKLSVAPSGIGLTGLPSFFWLADPPGPITASAGVGGLTVTAEARPIQFVWDFGDGVDKVTAQSGRQWTRRRLGNISHLYETKGRYDLRVEVVWEASWRIGSGPWQPLGYFSNSDERPYPVREVVAILVRAR